MIIIGRGGGSIEDLWGFNSEKLARKIFAMQTPVISAVGHETDFTSCDFVSDRRAPTPSAAAEIAVPDVRAERQRLDLLAERTENGAMALLESCGQALAEAAKFYGSKNVDRLFGVREEKLKGVVGKAQSLSPLAVLSRGYAVVSKDGKAVKTAEEISVGESLEIQLQQGKIKAKVEEK